MRGGHLGVALAGVLCAACGARTGLLEHEAGPVVPECSNDSDCNDGLFCTGVEACREGRCIPGAPVICMDGDECTLDACDEARLRCTHTPATHDADGDGFAAPRGGFRPGAPGACGDDCNDANAGVHPGATEVCNGVDDDCNGVIDDNATFTPGGGDTHVSDIATAPSGTGGVAWSGDRYMSSFWGYTQRTSHVYFSSLDRVGTPAAPGQIRITETPSDAYGAAVAWSGRVLGIVWQDRRDGDYEIYFNRLTPTGEKLGPDQRVTFAQGFSINASITWTGSEFVLAWQDERGQVDTGGYEIYTQRIDGEGRQIEDNHRMTMDPANSESPVIASSPGGLAIAWLDGRGPGGTPLDTRGIWFSTWTFDLRRTSPDTRLTPVGDNVVSPTLAWNRDRWVVAWHDADIASPDHEVWGATRDAAGAAITAPRRLTNDPGFSRYPSLVTLGDRVLLIWADDRAGAGYDIYARMLGADLLPLTMETRVTTAPRDSVYPTATLGPDGDVGILFQDQRDRQWQVYFTRLNCAIPR